MRFKARLEDLVHKKVLAEIPLIRTSSYERAVLIARRRLKKMQVYKDNENVREFVRVVESMDGVDIAGYEFDVLPEELRRYALLITQTSKKK